MLRAETDRYGPAIVCGTCGNRVEANAAVNQHPLREIVKEENVSKVMKHPPKSKYPLNEQGQRIRTLRINLALTQKEFVKPFSLGNTAVSDWERKGCVDLVLSKIAKQYGCSLEWLKWGNGPMLSNGTAGRQSLEGSGSPEEDQPPQAVLPARAAAPAAPGLHHSLKGMLRIDPEPTPESTAAAAPTAPKSAKTNLPAALKKAIDRKSVV